MVALYADRFITLRRIARISGIPVRRLQHWKHLARYLAWTVLASASAWVLVQQIEMHSIVRLAAGAAAMALVYLPMNYRRAQ